jgi:hypothetical protein
VRRRGLEPPPGYPGPGPQPDRRRVSCVHFVLAGAFRPPIGTQWTDWTGWTLSRAFSRSLARRRFSHHRAVSLNVSGWLPINGSASRLLPRRSRRGLGASPRRSLLVRGERLRASGHDARIQVLSGGAERLLVGRHLDVVGAWAQRCSTLYYASMRSRTATASRRNGGAPRRDGRGVRWLCSRSYGSLAGLAPGERGAPRSRGPYALVSGSGRGAAPCGCG